MDRVMDTLEKIELGEASASEARLVVSELLKEGSDTSYARLYSALGAWLWKALDGRRRDDELRQWFDIVRRASAALSTRNAAYAERLRAFYDLLEMSIATSEVADASEILNRQHVVAILKLLQAAGERPLEKAAIARELGLKPANLSRILHMMANARLVERTTYGKEAHFCMTRDGATALAKREAPAARPVRPALPQAPSRVIIADDEEAARRPSTPPILMHATSLAYGLTPDHLQSMAEGDAEATSFLTRLANLLPTPLPTPGPVPAQAQQVQIQKPSYRGAQAVAVSEKKSGQAYHSTGPMMLLHYK
jgi:predicted transcriptional regulator